MLVTLGDSSGAASHLVVPLARYRTTETLTLAVSGSVPFTAKFAVTLDTELPSNYVSALIDPH